jgi:8-oxo-dGTP pyrophosphatase MutT (NUDIX family)
MRREAPLEQVAALPFRRDASGVQVMLVTTRQSQRWIIPKSWQIRGLKAHRCAALEAYEEAGLSGSVSKSAIGEFEYLKQLGPKAAPCRVHVFAFEATREKRRWPEMHERKRAWFTPEQAAAIVLEPGLRKILLRFAPTHRAGTGARRLAREGASLLILRLGRINFEHYAAEGPYFCDTALNTRWRGTTRHDGTRRLSMALPLRSPADGRRDSSCDTAGRS